MLQVLQGKETLVGEFPTAADVQLLQQRTRFCYADEDVVVHDQTPTQVQLFQLSQYGEELQQS